MNSFVSGSFASRRLGVLCVVLWAIVGSIARADELQAVMDLARAGAHQLALQEMDRRQPDYAADQVGWMRWERQRLAVLELQHDWTGLIERIRRSPAGLPDSLQYDLLTRHVRARLALDQPARARELLRRALWEQGRAAPEELVQRWRQLLVRSYLQGGAVDDAQMALQRYQQDYADTSLDGYLLSAAVRLRAGRPAEALDLLADVEAPRAVPFRLLARLRHDPDAAEAVSDAARKALETADSARLEARLWAVQARASEVAVSPADRIEALEAALALGVDADSPLFAVDGEALWEAYLARGRQLGNEQQLLIGDDERWYFAATEAMETQPRRARALFAVLALKGAEASRRDLGHDYLARLLLETSGGHHILYALYLDNARFPEIESIPEIVRYLLVEAALAQRDLPTASRLMRGLSAPPSRAEEFSWQLQRARVMILTSDIGGGVAILEGLLENQAQWPAEDIDRFMQVVFDLQRLKAHEQAIDILMRLELRQAPLQQRRERLFWIAESQAALDRDRLAALYFLQSAILEDAYAMDPWAQTARYHAAKSLRAAGLYSDAASLLEGLLKVTQDANRRAVLRHELQQLQGRIDE